MIVQACSSITKNKFRAFLAVLGIGIGSAAVVSLLYSGILATESALRQIKHMGTQLLAVSVVDKTGYSLSQLESLYARSTSIKHIAPIKKSREVFFSDDTKIIANLVQSLPSFFELAGIKIGQGRLLLPVESESCAIGAGVADKFRQQGNWNLLGKRLSFTNNSCLVVGIMANSKSNFFLPVEINNSVLMLLPSTAYNLNEILIGFKDGVNVSEKGPYVSASLRSMLPKASFYERTPKFLIDHIKSEKENMQWLLGVVGGISLLVGGIGIMNIMLVSVIERTQEIGLRLAIGATPQLILRMFLFESLVLCLFGGIFGVITGLLISYVIAYFSGWAFSWHLWPIVLSFSVSSIVGVFFGYYPAKQAAKLDPIQSIRGNSS